MANTLEYREKKLKLSRRLFGELLAKTDTSETEVRTELKNDLEEVEDKLKEIEEEKNYARVWTKDSSPDGDVIDKHRFDELVKSKTVYEIFIIDKGEYKLGSVGKVFLNKVLGKGGEDAKKAENIREVPNSYITPFEYRLLC
jgi:hypothetical protein